MDALSLLRIIDERGGIATLKTDERGGFKINVCPRALAVELLVDLKRLKPDLIRLMYAASLVKQPADDSSYCRLSWGLYVPRRLPSLEFQKQKYHEALAHEILEATYFNELENKWCICWSRGRHAWQRYTLDHGGTLDDKSGLPSIGMFECIEWARTQLGTPQTTDDSDKGDSIQTALFELEVAA